ncbi:hypothetical protein BJ742DRAFT_366241 [Cladochytrium replicatum]|nr:hypothetical protein BJ742DRAFT_366241 [Cladochytrium replicatum]
MNFAFSYLPTSYIPFSRLADFSNRFPVTSSRIASILRKSSTAIYNLPPDIRSHVIKLLHAIRDLLYEIARWAHHWYSKLMAFPNRPAIAWKQPPGLILAPVAGLVTTVAPIHQEWEDASLVVGKHGRVLYVANANFLALNILVLYAAVYKKTGKLPRTVVDPIHFKVPVWKHILEFLGCVTGSWDTSITSPYDAPSPSLSSFSSALLTAGHTFVIVPGGYREALRKRSDPKNTLVWHGSVDGFASHAVAHGYTVVPVASVGPDDMFTIVGEVPVDTDSWPFTSHHRRPPITLTRTLRYAATTTATALVSTTTHLVSYISRRASSHPPPATLTDLDAEQTSVTLPLFYPRTYERTYLAFLHPIYASTPGTQRARSTQLLTQTRDALSTGLEQLVVAREGVDKSDRYMMLKLARGARVVGKGAVRGSNLTRRITARGLRFAAEVIDVRESRPDVVVQVEDDSSSESEGSSSSSDRAVSPVTVGSESESCYDDGEEEEDGSGDEVTLLGSAAVPVAPAALQVKAGWRKRLSLRNGVVATRSRLFAGRSNPSATQSL